MGYKEFYDFANSKLCLIEGDIVEEGFGLSEESRNMIINEAEIFLNNAANTKLVDKLKNTLKNNYYSTVQAMILAKKCKKLLAFTHVSSLSVNFDKLEGIIEEEILEYNKYIEDDWNTYVKIMSLTDAEAEKQMPKYLKVQGGTYPVSYSFSKCMAEKHVHKNKGNFNCAIIRPSVILGALKEPTPGWTDSMMGGASVGMGVANGLADNVPAYRENNFNIIPVDIVCNSILILTAYHGNRKAQSDCAVYHCDCSHGNPITFA